MCVYKIYIFGRYITIRFLKVLYVGTSNQLELLQLNKKQTNSHVPVFENDSDLQSFPQTLISVTDLSLVCFRPAQTIWLPSLTSEYLFVRLHGPLGALCGVQRLDSHSVLSFLFPLHFLSHYLIFSVSLSPQSFINSGCNDLQCFSSNAR